MAYRVLHDPAPLYLFDLKLYCCLSLCHRSAALLSFIEQAWNAPTLHLSIGCLLFLEHF